MTDVLDIYLFYGLAQSESEVFLQYQKVYHNEDAGFLNQILFFR